MSRDPSAALSARGLAALVIQRVLDEDAYVAAALSHALSKSELSLRDRGLCTELVYGTMRTLPFLVRQLGTLGKIKQSDHIFLSHLLVAAYQLDFLDRIPAHAVLNEAVGAIRRVRGAQVAGFANAILRKLATQPASERTSLNDAILSSCPSWLKKRLSRDVGESEALALLASVENPRPTLRFVKDAPLPEWVKTECSPVAQVERVFRFEAGGDPRNHIEYECGAFSVQELGAVLVGYALGARPGERILDVCAGRGQKSFIAKEAVGPSGQVLSTDLHEHKLLALRKEAARFKVEVDTKQWDWTQDPPAVWQGAFDRVLVDAPCSGVGTLRRRPEIVRRLTPDTPARLAALQWEIVSRAAVAVRPGGTLLFATCSVLREEGPDLAARLCAGGQFEPACPPSEADGVLSLGQSGVSASTYLLPSRHNTDGYFLIRLKKAVPITN